MKKAWVIILLLGFATRLPFLDRLPTGYNWDETAYAYNAFSLWQTGQDEWGVRWPVFLKSFGEYKPALMSYLLIPFLVLDSQVSISPRMLTALLGILSIVGTAGVIYQLTKSAKSATLTALLIAITPLHIHYSRALMDPILGFTIFVFGLWAFLSHRQWMQILGSILLGISMYSYNAERIFVPLLIIGYITIFHRKRLHVFLKERWSSLSFFALFVVWLMIETLWGSGGTRSRIVSVFAFGYGEERLLERQRAAEQTGTSLWPLIDTERFYQYVDITERYFTHFSPDFLFFANGNLSSGHGFSAHGNVLPIFIPFLLYGLFLAVRGKGEQETTHLFMAWWILISPLASAVTIDVPHSGRVLQILPALLYFVALGLHSFSKSTHTQWFRPALVVMIASLVGLHFLWYLRDYHLLFGQESEAIWQGQYQEMVRYAHQERAKYTQVLISNYYDEPLIFYAWYNQVDPSLVQQATRNPFQMTALENVTVLEKAESTECALLRSNTLVIVPPTLSPWPIAPEKVFYFPHSGRVAFKAISSNSVSGNMKEVLQTSCALPQMAK